MSEPSVGPSGGSVRAVLVHGAWHDGSCWASVAHRLTGAGRDVRVVDLPSDRAGTSGRAYVDAVLDAAGPLGPPDRVVLVGHSLGGLVVPVAAQELGSARVAAMVLVAALVPRPGHSWQDRARGERPMVAGFGAGQVRLADGTTWWPPEAAAAELYAGVAEELGSAGGGSDGAGSVRKAVAGLRRQDWTITREVTALTAWPPVRTVRVVCAEDRVVDPAWSRSAAGAVPGAEVVELAGGHFPMLTRPAELAALIDSVVADTGTTDAGTTDVAADDDAGGARCGPLGPERLSSGRGSS